MGPPAGRYPSLANSNYTTRIAAEPGAGAIGIGLFHRPMFTFGSRALMKTMPSGLTQNTSTNPAAGQTAATPVRGSAEPGSGAIGTGLFQFPPFMPGSRAFVKTMPLV